MKPVFKYDNTARVLGDRDRAHEQFLFIDQRTPVLPPVVTHGDIIRAGDWVYGYNGTEGVAENVDTSMNSIAVCGLWRRLSEYKLTPWTDADRAEYDAALLVRSEENERNRRAAQAAFRETYGEPI